MRDSTIFYRSFYEAINLIPEEDQLNVYKAIFEYSLNMNETELTGVQKAVFTLIKPQLDANLKRYENGKKGGKPKQKETKPKPKANQTQTKPKANDNVNDNVNNNKNKKEEEKKHSLQLFIETLKNVPKIKDQLTYEQCEKLLEKYDKKTIHTILEQMENYKQAPSRYVSLYLTINNWIKLQKEKEKSSAKKEKDNHVPSPLRSTPITI